MKMPTKEYWQGICNNNDENNSGYMAKIHLATLTETRPRAALIHNRLFGITPIARAYTTLQILLKTKA